MQKGYQEGFSLIEMIIVVVIIGIVSVLSVPLYKKAIGASENTAIFAVTKVMLQEQTSFFSQQSRFARLNELNERFSNNFGVYQDNSIKRGKYTFTMSPATPTDNELKENFVIVATKTLDNVELPYVITMDASGDIVQVTP